MRLLKNCNLEIPGNVSSSGMGGLCESHKEPWNLDVFEGKSLSYMPLELSLYRFGSPPGRGSHQPCFPVPAHTGPGKELDYPVS